jgi:hypothetical protein
LIIEKWNKLSKKEKDIFMNLEKEDLKREKKQLL